MRLLNSITDSVGMNLSRLWERLKDRETWRAAVHGVTKSDTTWKLNNRTLEKRPSLPFPVFESY